MPWRSLVEWLWDDPLLVESHRERALAEARRWKSLALTGYRLGFLGMRVGMVSCLHNLI